MNLFFTNQFPKQILAFKPSIIDDLEISYFWIEISVKSFLKIVSN